MNRSAYPSYRPGKNSRLQKSGRRLLLQFIICIILVVLIIGVKKIDLALSNRVVDVFANQMKKDVSVEAIFSTGTEKAKELRDAFQTVSSQIVSDRDTFAVRMPADAAQAIPVFADDGRQTGLDFPVTADEFQIYAAAAGTITEIGTSDKIGRYVKVNHAKDIYTIYGNCTTVYANPMDKVEKGEVIALVRKSENPTFRFEMYQDGKAVNPNDFLEPVQ